MCESVAATEVKDKTYLPRHCGSLKILTRAPGHSGDTLQAPGGAKGTCVMQFLVPGEEETRIPWSLH